MERGRPLVIGHAAAGGEGPANTLAAVRACIASGADGMEIDVRLTADDIPVLLHDATLDRTTNLEGPLRERTFAEVQAADAGAGEPVPSLAEVLAVVDGRLTVMCELKATAEYEALDAALVDGVGTVLEAAGAGDWSAIHSFDAKIVERAREGLPNISAARISHPRDPGDISLLLGGTVRRGLQAISVEHRWVDAELVLRAKRRQLTVWTWTPDEMTAWDRVVRAGVDGIITNFPHRLSEHLGSGP